MSFIDFKRFLEPLFQSQTPFVCWKLPNQTSVFSTEVLTEVDGLSPGQSTFYMQDFARERTLILNFSKENLKTFSIEMLEPPEKRRLEFAARTDLRFIDQVNQAKTRIAQGEIQKVVLSRAETSDVKDLDLIASFAKMAIRYQSAFCYLIFTPELGFWMGASPETLCKIRERCLSSVALAGTRFADSYTTFTEKEFYEQALVTDYITMKMSEMVYRLRVSDREEVMAGNLIHLQTTIEGRLLDSIGIQEVINALHPTPAVCGSPVFQAKKVISEIENYDRSFYTGIVGVISDGGYSKTDAELFVNLRCMHFKDNALTCYAGCGIVADSMAELEFEETENKMKTIRNILLT